MKQKITRNFNLSLELSSYAAYFKNEIILKRDNDTLDGITILAVSCTLFSIFALEARFNLLITKIHSIKEISDKTNFLDKFNFFIKDSGFNFTDKYNEHYSNIRNAESLRNTIAHFKPYKINKTIEIPNSNPFNLFKNDKEKWETNMDYNFSLKVFDSCFVFWSYLKHYYKVELIDEINYGSIG